MSIRIHDRSPERWDQLSSVVLDAVGLCRIGLLPAVAELASRLESAGAQTTAVGSGPLEEAVDAVVAIVDFEDPSEFPEIATALNKVPCEVVLLLARYLGTDDVQELGLRNTAEQAFIDAGLIKHPISTKLLGYEALGTPSSEFWAIFERPVRSSSNTNDLERLKQERNLHADMLREAGERSDAHVVRYQLAAEFVRPSDTVLDAACGLGYGAHVLRALSPAEQIIGIDGSDWGIDYARASYEERGVAFRVGFLPQVLDDFAPSSIDFVASLETLEHVENPDALLDAFHRVLRPGGRLFISVPNDWADETGKDPSPYHLHVYDWQSVQAQLGRRFIVERAWRLIASGCKQGQHRRWAPHPRVLQEVSLDDASTYDSEWWLILASKSPLESAPVPFTQKIHGAFSGSTHLVDFGDHYGNPWLVASLVELPWRVQNKVALRELADQLLAASPVDSADHGAALTITGYRLLEGALEPASCDDWLAKAAHYRSQADSTNPHVRRWKVSLAYLQGRLLERLARRADAEHAYSDVLAADVIEITPTLGTKLVDAAWRLGYLHWVAQRRDLAREAWHRGVQTASNCLHVDWIEFIGDWERPFPFALNDAGEILDGAVRCALALRATFDTGVSHTAIGARLFSIARQSLRSALRRLETDVVSTRHELDIHVRALADAQRLAHERYRTVGELQQSVASAGEQLTTALKSFQTTQAALNAAQKLAIERHEQIVSLVTKLDRTQAALDEAQRLAIERYDSIAQLASRLDHTQSALNETQALAIDRQGIISALETQLADLQEANAALQIVAADRLEQLTMRIDDGGAAKANAAQLEHRLAALQFEQSAMRSKFERLHSDHSYVLRTWSWRLTSPFRRIAAKILSLLRRH